jgi:hypothetical protein
VNISLAAERLLSLASLGKLNHLPLSDCQQQHTIRPLHYHNSTERTLTTGYSFDCYKDLPSWELKACGEADRDI